MAGPSKDGITPISYYNVSDNQVSHGCKKKVGFEVKGVLGSENKHEVDCYDHIESGVFYSNVNIPGPGSNSDDFGSQLAKGCDCTGGQCSTSDCHCISLYGLSYTADGLLTTDQEDGSVIECNSECLCRRLSGNESSEVGSCQNRLVQFGPLVGLEIFAAENKGYGLRCRYFINKGSFICEYAGEVIGLDEARKRIAANKDYMNYVFVLNEFVGKSKLIQTCVDPQSIGNIGRYVNHSCQPNSAIVPVRVENPVPRLAIFALHDINAGEEITFDYGCGGISDSEPSVYDLKQCFCKSPNCKLYLPYEKDLV